MRRGEAYPWGKPGRLLQAEKVDGAFDLTTIREVLPGMELREVRPEALARRRAALKTQIQRWLEERHRFQAWLAEEEDTSPPSFTLLHEEVVSASRNSGLTGIACCTNILSNAPSFDCQLISVDNLVI